jgi:transcriptional regulator with XRE-family HTH domain
MSATLGGLIKDLRIQKNLSQLEISLALGWKESSRLSRIEQGRVEAPSRLLLDNLMTAMKLSAEERNRLYIAGSYLPTEEDISLARTKLAPLIDTWSFPAASLDFAWRIIYTNQKLYKLYDLDRATQKQIEKNTPNVLEIIFAPGFKGDQKDREFSIRLLAHFQFAQKSRTKERWYLDLIQRMMKNPYFRELWPLAHAYNNPNYDVYNFAYKKVNQLIFYDIIVPVFNDARFSVEYYFPADLNTHKYFQ